MSLGLSTDLLNISSSANSSSQSADCAIDTRFFAGCNLQEFTQKVEEGLQGEDKEFFQRIKNRGIERTFQAYDTDANGTLSGQEAIGVSAVGINQRKFSEAINGGGMDSYLDSLLAKMSTTDTTGSYSNILSAFAGSLTGGAAGTSTSSAAANFGLQYSGKSAAEMSGLMSSTGFHSGAWCADFVYYCLTNAGVVPEGYDSINHASCSSIASWARQTGRAFSDPSQAKPGDLLIMNSEGHIGIVTKVDSEGIHTIEGNTSNASGIYNSPGGGGWVCEKVRDFSCVSTFVRI